MKLYRKRFVVGLVLEILMWVAPISLDFLGAAGEYLLETEQTRVTLSA